MNSPNYPPPGGPQGPYGPPQGQPYGQRPPQTPPGGQPFGGPPPQGQPYGGPPPQGPPVGGPGGFGGPAGGPPAGGFGPGGPGGPGGAPPAYPTPPPPPPSAKPSKARLFVMIGIAVALVGAGVFFAIKNWGTSAANAKVGECIKVNEATTTDADVEKIDCNSEEAVYKVAATFDSSSATCPEGDYDTYTQSGSRTADVTLCLALNAKEGDCFAKAGQSVDRVGCTEPNVYFKVVKVLDGTGDAAGCPEGTEGLRAPTPAPGIVHCIGDPAATGTT